MVNEIRIYTQAELKSAIRLDLDVVDVIERAFAALASGSVVMPDILSMELADAHGEVDVKTAHIPGFDGFAIKVSPGFFNNPALGLPSLNGLMILLCSKTGMVRSVFLDNGYLTDIRTAAAGADAARHLAPQQVTTAGVIGAGVQARLQIQAAHLVRPFEQVLVWGRDMAKAQACADDLAQSLGIAARACACAQEVVAGSQLVVTTTPAKSPIIQADWLHPGLHITAIGSDQTGKTEIDPAALAAADLYVCDSIRQCQVSGELEGAERAGTLGAAQAVELGTIVAGAHSGRRSADDITICDLTGTGAQDTAIASHVSQLLNNLGTVVQN